jgi:hypothetical protein
MSTYLDKLIESVKWEINQELERVAHIASRAKKKRPRNGHFQAPRATP